MINHIVLIALATLSANALAGMLVTDISGKAEIEGKGPVSMLAEIPEGAKLALAGDARLVAVDLSTGKEYVLKGNHVYVITTDGPQAADGKPVEAKVLPVKNLPAVRISVGKVAQASVVMRGVTDFNVPVLIKPARTAVITSRPVFQWGSVDEAVAYRLILTKEEGANIWETKVSGTSVTLPEARALIPGEKYAWRIEALSADKQVISDAAAHFSVAPESVIQRLKNLKPAADASFARRVLYAAQLREAGAAADARELWRALAKERPDDAILRALAN